MDIESKKVSSTYLDPDFSKENCQIDSNDYSDEGPFNSPSNIIGTHPNEIITSVNADNGYPVRQENGQRKTGPPPG